MSHLALVALVVREYQPAIDFFVNVLQFERAEDVPSFTNDGLDATHARLVAAGVHFDSAPRSEAYGRVAVFLDLEGNRWDLLG